MDRKTTTTTTGPAKVITTWLGSQVDIKLVIGLIGAIVYAALFYKDSHDNWDKTKSVDADVKTKVGAEEFRALKEQVNGQYSRQRDVDNIQNADIKEIRLWMEFQKGKEAK